MSEYAIRVTASPTDPELAIIQHGLTSFNEAAVGPANRIPLAVVVHDETGAMIAGISGFTTWGWLFTHWLWVAESARGHGLAGQMLAAAEDEARHRGCHGAWIDTFNPVALRTYQRAGYVPFGALPEYPKGGTRTFLQKSLG